MTEDEFIKNLPAFPQYGFDKVAERFTSQGGMALRDYFAAKAMQGLFAAGGGKVLTADDWAAQAYIMADAMLKARGHE